MSSGVIGCSTELLFTQLTRPTCNLGGLSLLISIGHGDGNHRWHYYARAQAM